MSAFAICDATCIIALDRIGRLEILQNAFDEVSIPPAVASELRAGKLRVPEWLQVRSVGSTTVLRIPLKPGSGEREALALAMETPGAIVVVDEWQGRAAARKLGIASIGTVGVLLREKRNGRIDRITPILEKLRKAGFRMSEELLNEALRLAREI